ncbi:MAG TPA: rhodanese-like domain-containing protein [Clostridia bacterium]|nr:rhodanese-like domain-containing protein [Clostridia bacterium]
MLFGRKPGFSYISMPEAQTELNKNSAIRIIDVRTPEEYRAGHIPGSMNVPLDHIGGILNAVPDKSERLFVYCLSGARSRSASQKFTDMGYTDVNNIGGISQWTGKLESA